MKRKLLLKSIILSVAGILALTTVSCDKDDDLLDFYSSQNRSEVFFGKWQGVESDNQHIFFEFTASEYIISSNMNDSQSSTYVWYNDDQQIHYIRKGKGSSNDARVSIHYKFNSTKDTLKTSFGDNLWSTYAKVND